MASAPHWTGRRRCRKRTSLANVKSLMEGLVDGVLPADLATFHLVEQEITRLQA